MWVQVQGVPEEEGEVDIALRVSSYLREGEELLAEALWEEAEHARSRGDLEEAERLEGEARRVEEEAAGKVEKGTARFQADVDVARTEKEAARARARARALESETSSVEAQVSSLVVGLFIWADEWHGVWYRARCLVLCCCVRHCVGVDHGAVRMYYIIGCHYVYILYIIGFHYVYILYDIGCHYVRARA